MYTVKGRDCGEIKGKYYKINGTNQKVNYKLKMFKSAYNAINKYT